MTKKLLIIILIILSLSFIYSQDLKQIDDLYRDGKYQDGLNKLIGMHDKSNPNPAVIWRIARMYYEIAEELSDKKAKIDKYTDGMNSTAPYLNIKEGKKLDRAQVVFWYAVNLGARGEVIGIKESLDIVPKLFELANKAISIDPTFGAPYLLKGRIDDAVPSFLGGDKFRMGENFSRAIKMEKELNILVDSANGFIKRGWDVDKKKKMKEKMNRTDGTPQNLSDKEYAKQLLKSAIELYFTIDKPTKREKNKYAEAIKLYKKVK